MHEWRHHRQDKIMLIEKRVEAMSDAHREIRGPAPFRHWNEEYKQKESKDVTKSKIN